MKSVQEILQSLNLDLSNPEVVLAAQEAISKILSGRTGPSEKSLSDRLKGKARRPEEEEGTNEPIDLGEFEQEIDPDLIQPPSRQQGGSDIDTEIEDEDDVLNKVRQLGKQDQPQEQNGSGSDGGQPPQMPEDDGQDHLNHNNDQSDSQGSLGGQQSKGNQDSEADGESESGNSEGSRDGGTEDKQDKNEPGEDGQTSGENGDSSEDGSTGTSGAGGTGDGKPTDEPGETGDTPGNRNGKGETDDHTEKDTDTDGGFGENSDDGGEEEGEDVDGFDGSAEGDDEGEDADSDLTSKLTSNNPKNDAQQIQISRTLKAAKNAQSKAEANGQDAIGAILDGCIDMLEEMQDELKSDQSSEISDRKMSQVIQRTLDAINEVDKHGLVFKDDEDRAQQVSRIKAAMSDTGIQAELSAEEVEQIRADRQAIINNKKEIEKYAGKSRSSFKGFEDFIQSLRKSLALQIEAEKTKANSWAAINRRHDGTDVVKPGIKNRILPSTRVPVIDFYFDCSASWGANDLLKGDEALGKIAQLEKDGEIKVNVFYFADNVYEQSEPPRDEGGTRAWNRIIENIVLTKATNVVIMTDSDMRWQCSDPPHRGYKVNGFVWYLWKDGDNAQNLPNLLQGRSGTLQYSFSST